MNTVPAIATASSRRTRRRSVDVIVAPWYAASRGARWLAVGVFVLGIGCALASGTSLPGRQGEVIALFFYSFGLGWLWFAWFSSLLLVARDARRLCLPGAIRNMQAATWLYAVIAALGPALIVAATGGDIVLAAQIPALAIATCLAFQLLPRWLAAVFGFAPAVYIGLYHAHLVPSPLQPQFEYWAWWGLVVLVIIDVLRWRQVLASDEADDSSAGSAMLLQMRRNTINRDWFSIDRNWALRRSNKRALRIDLRGVGPANPTRTLALALGGWYVPLTWRGRLDTFARVALPLLLFIPLTWLMNFGREEAALKAMKFVGVSAGIWVGVFGTVVLATVSIAVMDRRWKSGADLAVLALLPGIDNRQAPAYLARVAFPPALTGFVLLWLCMLITNLVLAAGIFASLLATLFVAGIAACTLMAAYKVWAGQSMRKAAQVILALLLTAMVYGSVMLVVIAAQSVPGVWTQRAQWLTVAAWLALIAWATWQGLRAWQALRRRPHPFLANGP